MTKYVSEASANKQKPAKLRGSKTLVLQQSTEVTQGKVLTYSQRIRRQNPL